MKKLTLLLTIVSLFFGTFVTQAQNTREWSIIASYTIPGKASGLTWDGTYLYSGLYAAPGDDNLIYQIDPTDGSYTLHCAGPHEDSYGLSHDGTNFWTTDRTGSFTPAIAVEFDDAGALVSQFDLPATYHSGIEYDNGDFWVCCYYDPDGMVYKLDDQGTIITQFPSPNEQPWAICKENDNLWIADYNANMLYKVDQSGNLLESHESENIKPAGITFDGQYLWYVDGGLGIESTLYKVDLYGTGTPQMTVPVTFHDYGNVVIGQSSTWDMEVQNTGSADLEITGISIPSGEPVTTTFTPPVTITPGGSETIPITYTPTDPDPLNTSITVQSTDPVNPNVNVLLTGHGIVSGPNLLASASSHDYGLVRVKAFKRWFLEVQNNGSEDLVISDIAFTTTDFSLDDGTELPLEIGTLETVQIGVWFHPIDDDAYSDVMSLTSNDPDPSVFELSLSGAGLDKDWVIGDPLWYYFIPQDDDMSPKAITSIADITGDKVDDVIVCSEDYMIRCLNGNSHDDADVIWEFEIVGGSLYHQNSLTTIADIDGDDFDDVIVGTAWGDRSIVALSGKTGEQIWKHDTHEYGGGGWVYQVHVLYDYNEDGILDVLAATGDDSGDTGPKRIYCLDGTDGESIWENFTGGPNFSVIGIEDFTGDNVPDVLAGASNESENEGKVLGINGSTGQTEWTWTPDGTSVWALAQLDDVTGDGIEDVIAGDFGGHIYLIDPTSGVPFDNTTIGNELVLRFEVLDDVNGDDYSDILVAHSGTNGIVLDGTDGSNIWFKSLADKSWCVSKTNDLDGDGINDVLIGTLYSSNVAYFLEGTGGGELESINYGEPIDAISSIPDIVGDGSHEMVVGGRQGKVYCYSGGIDALTGLPGDDLTSNKLGLTAYPNPFRNILNIGFVMEEASEVSVDLYNIAGLLRANIYKGKLSKGYHELQWGGSENRSNLPAGMYIIRITTPNGIYTGKVAGF